MRLTEAIVKPMFARAISTNRVKALNEAFKQHLGLEDVFAQVLSEHGSGKVWKPVTFKAYECSLFSAMLNATATRPQESAIERVVHQVWPDSDGFAPQAPLPPLAGPSGSRKRKLSSKAAFKQAEWGGASAAQQQEYKRQYLHLWSIFATVMEQMRCRDVDRQDLKDFGKNCSDLGARWYMLMPKNRCGALYLHTIMMHGGAFMSHLLQLKLTIGMLENSGAERRHQIGKVHFRKSLAGGGKMYSGMASNENRTAYLTLRGVHIWQYGRDLLAHEIAQMEDSPTPTKPSFRGRVACGFMPQLHKTDHGKLTRVQDDEATMDLGGFLSDERMERLDQEAPMDLDEELMNEQVDLRDAMDTTGGLQVQDGPYYQRLDFRGEGTDEESHSSGDTGSANHSALSDGESNSECASEVSGDYY
jgi:hypothetical protein